MLKKCVNLGRVLGVQVVLPAQPLRVWLPSSGLKAVSYKGVFRCLWAGIAGFEARVFAWRIWLVEGR